MMPNLSIINIHLKRIADIYIKVKNVTSKLHNTSASITFIKITLLVDVIPKLAVVEGQFIKEMDSLTALQKLL